MRLLKNIPPPPWEKVQGWGRSSSITPNSKSSISSQFSCYNGHLRPFQSYCFSPQIEHFLPVSPPDLLGKHSMIGLVSFETKMMLSHYSSWLLGFAYLDII